MDAPKAEIVVEEGTESGRVLSLRPSKVIEIGREGNFRLEDSALSRRHCRILFEGGRYRVEDQGSTWGTFVNGGKIASHVLSHGDRIKIGNHVLVFTSEPPVPAAPVLLVEEDPEDAIPSAPMAAAPAPAPPRRPSPERAAAALAACS